MQDNIFQEDRAELPAVCNSVVFRVWQLDTVVTRVLSLVLLVVVYFAHWQRVFLTHVPFPWALGRADAIRLISRVCYNTQYVL